MASVAICPHCYLQLIVPDGVGPTSRVQCPTCTKEFDLGQATLRTIPEVAVVERSAEAAAAAAARSAAPTIEYIAPIDETNSGSAPDIVPMEPRAEERKRQLDTEGQADEGVAAWFGAKSTLPDVKPVAEANAIADAEVEAKAQVEDRPGRAEGDAVEVSGESADLTIEPFEPRAARPSAITLSEMMPPRKEPEATLSGPSFDLPNVPLRPETGATIEMEAELPLGAPANTEFELDDVDFESTPASAESPTLDEFPAVEDPAPTRLTFGEPDFAPAPGDPVFVPIGGPRRRRSVVGTLVGTAVGGVVGLSLGYYVLLYLMGPQIDFLEVAQYLPQSMLPASFQSTAMEMAEAPEKPAPPAEAAADVARDDDTATAPASYTESADESVEGDKAAVASYLDESSESEEPPAGPASYDAPPEASAAEPLPISGPTYSAEQLSTVLDEAEQAQMGLVDGDLSDAAVRRTKGLSYAKLCDLAHALTFFDRSSPAENAAELERRAEQLFRETLADAHARGEVARIATIWIESPHRRHGGVFLAGSVGGGEIAGDVYEYRLSTEDGSELTLLMPQPLDPETDASSQPLGIVGTIVEKPADEIAGYSGAASRAIWVHSAIPLE
jgi:hypothetical protein